MKIILTGGGTGGHLFPLVAVSKYLKDEHSQEEIKFIFYGPRGSLEKEIMNGAGIKQRQILSGKLRRYFSWYYLVDLIKMPLGFLQTMFYLLIDMPDVIFAKGGYASVPVIMIAWLYRIPILIHESDAQPGLANQFMANLANKVAISFERAKIHLPISKIVLTRTPISKKVLNGSAEKARKMLGIKKDVKPVIFILGGSQGANFINRHILKMLKSLITKYQIIHQTGKNDYDGAVAEAQRQGFKVGASDYYPVAFIGEEMKHFYALADVIISRAGSTTITEIAANKKPSILVPITQSANNHQRLNAFEVARQGGTVVLEENNFKINLLLLRLKQLTEKSEIRNELIKNIQKFYNPNATKIIGDELISLAHNN
jgi:UDP-N-acetylglucosamine--N-acetylmuramyl-(pentapeptide) pyrophosphoryl-undecaprenol N-acetylglucosamine transferase